MHWLKHCCAFLMAFLAINVAYAETITFAGKLSVKEPEITANFPTEANAFSLSPVNVSLANATPGLCSLTGAKAEYNTPSMVDCVVEWTSLPSNQTVSGIGVSGKYANTGPQTYEYSISVFLDGKTNSQVIKTGSFSVSALEPRPAVVTSIQYSGSTGFGDLLDGNIFLTDKDMPTLTINVEPRGYDQQFTMGSTPVNMSHSWTSCTVPAGDSSCSDAYDQTHNTEYGLETLQFDFQCGGECGTNFPTLGSGVSATYEWDFRPPLAAEIAGEVRSSGSIELTPVVENLRIGETYTLSIVQPPNGATATVSADGQTISFAHTTGISSSVSFRYVLDTSQGRQVEEYARVNIVRDQSLPTFSMPSLPASETGEIQYTSTGSARYSSGDKFSGTISGTMELLASSTTGLTVSGSQMTPGQSMPMSLNFVEGIPAMGLRLSAASSNMAAEMVFTPNDPILPRIKFPITGYTVTADLNLPDTAVAGLQNVTATLTSSCTVMDEAEAMARSNVCFAEFTLPPGLERTGDRTIGGIIGSGSHTVEYKVGFYSGSTRYWLASGSKTVTTSDPEFNYVLHGTPIDRLEVEQRVTLMDDTPDPAFQCVYYEGEKVETTISTLNSGRIFCHVDWINLPAGFETQQRSPNMLSGRLESSADATFYARITSILPGGVDLVIHDEPITPELIEPVIPNFEITPAMAGENGEFGYTAGHPRIRVSGNIQMNGDVMLTSYLNGEEVGFTMPSFSGAVRDLAAPENIPVGQTETLTVRAAYRTAPDIYTEQEIKVVAVPPRSIRPSAVTTDGFNDVDEANLTAAIADISWACRMAECPYDVATFGKWDIYLGEYRGYRDPPARVSESYTTDANGVATIPHSLTTDRQRYVLVADFISDEGSLIDSRESPPVIYDVLKKSQFDGEVTSRRVSGEAPLSVGLRFTMDERSDIVHVRNVKWQVDKGTGWETVEDTEGRRGLYMRRVFEEGVYQVRAIVTNPAGIDTYSEALTIEAYNLPDVELVGSTYLLPGTTEEFSLLIDGEPANSDEWIINWEMDEFDALDTETVTLSSDVNHRTRMRYRAHLRRYPDDPRAGVIGSTTIIWDTPRYVRYKFNAPREVWDTGETYTLSAEPYADRFGLTFMGEWTLPDGTIVPGTSIEYRPDRRGYGYKLLNFRGWFEEWPEAERESRVRILHLSDLLPKIDVIHDYVEPLQAPVDAFFRVDVDRRLSSTELELIETQIDVDDGQLTYDAGLRFGAAFTTGGTKTIRAVWTNQEGDRVESASTVEVLPPEPLDMTLEVLTETKYIESSGSAWVLPNVAGLAPNDQLTLYSGFLNGEPWPITQRFGKILYPIPAGPGEHELKLVADTKYGYRVEGTATITMP